VRTVPVPLISDNSALLKYLSSGSRKAAKESVFPPAKPILISGPFFAIDAALNCVSDTPPSI
jgi:hypothetical protein